MLSGYRLSVIVQISPPARARVMSSLSLSASTRLHTTSVLSSPSSTSAARVARQQLLVQICRSLSTATAIAASRTSAPAAPVTPTKPSPASAVCSPVHPSSAASSSAASSAPSSPLLIHGQFVQSAATAFFDVLNPATQQVETRVPLCPLSELEAAVRSASAAFPAWRNTPVTQRQRILFSFHTLIRRHEDELVESIVRENGKTVNDAKGDLFRGLEVVEYATGVASALQGETIEQLGRGVDTYSYRQPLGVCAGICPFNFPAMIPLWMWPLAVACGNTFVLKPSERTPSTAVILARLAQEAGLPAGVLNLVHGQVDTVNFLCDAPDIRAISFVGGNAAGLHIHERGTKNGKKVQSNMGAKVRRRAAHHTCTARRASNNINTSSHVYSGGRQCCVARVRGRSVMSLHCCCHIGSLSTSAASPTV